jgi:hypothetical protein
MLSVPTQLGLKGRGHPQDATPQSEETDESSDKAHPSDLSLIPTLGLRIKSGRPDSR